MHLTLFLRKPTSPMAFANSSLLVNGYSLSPELIVDFTLLTCSSLEISCFNITISLSSFSVFSIKICILPENCCLISRTCPSSVFDLATTPEYFYLSWASSSSRSVSCRFTCSSSYALFPPIFDKFFSACVTFPVNTLGVSEMTERSSPIPVIIDVPNCDVVADIFNFLRVIINAKAYLLDLSFSDL